MQIKNWPLVEVEEWPKPEWLIEKLVPKNSLSVIYGKPKIGKSLLALDLSIRLANEGKSILYLIGEGLGGLGARIKAWKAAFGDFDSSSVSFMFAERMLNLRDRGAVLEYMQKVKQEPWYQQLVLDVDVDDEESEPGGEHTEFDSVDLIVIDTLSRAMVGADENDAKDMSTAVEHLDMLRREMKSTILVLHHTPKDDDYVERGSGALRGAADVMLRMYDQGGLRNLKVDVSRDSEAGTEKQYQIVPCESSAVLKPWTGGVWIKKGSVKDRILDAVNNGAASADEIAWAAKLGKQQVWNNVSDLVRDGLLTKKEDSTYAKTEA